MTAKATTEYKAKVRKHIASQFPGEGPPPRLERIDSPWCAAVRKECPPPKTVKDPDTVILEAIDEYLLEGGYDPIGVVFFHAERHHEVENAKRKAAAEKHRAETEPLRQLIAECVRNEVGAMLMQAGVLKLPQQPANVLPFAPTGGAN